MTDHTPTPIPAETTADYSPSEYHRELLRAVQPSLCYAGGDAAAWQRLARGKLADLLGYPVLERTGRPPLEVRTLWTRDHELGTIEKIVFTSQPGADVPAYVCLPKGVKPPYVFFICLQGDNTGMHNSIAVSRDESQPLDMRGEGDRDFAVGCLRRGLAALCLEQRSFGERQETRIPQPLDYLCHQAAMHAQLLGTTLLAERVFDVDRALDYLQARGDADLARVGCLGNSGGGTVTMLSAALLDRIRFAMLSCCFSSLAASLMDNFHCVCNYVPGLQQFLDMGDLAGLASPRPLVIVGGVQDGIFPIQPAREQFQRTRAVYAALGAEDRCHFVEGPEGHRFYAELAWPVMLEEVRRTA